MSKISKKGKKCPKTIKKGQIKEVNYFWYDHMLIRDMPKMMNLINECIEKHLYNEFKFVQYLLNNFDYYTKETCGEFEELIGEPIIYLPNHIQIVWKNGRVTYRKMTKELFMMIKNNEYECG